MASSNGNAGASGSGSSTRQSGSSGGSGSSQQRGAASSSSSSSTSLESVDSLVGAAFSISQSGGNEDSRLRLVNESLLPALQYLESKGTAAGLPGHIVLQSSLLDGTDPLHALAQSRETHGSLAFLYILIARCTAENADVPVLLPYIAGFCQIADGVQLRLAPHKVGLLGLYIDHYLRNQPGTAVTMLHNLLVAFAGTYGFYLNAVYPTYLYACLRAGDLSEAARILCQVPMTSIDMRVFPVTYQDNLKYHLYGGTILATVENYSQAADLLERAVCAPAHNGATSLMQVDAYKRLILVQCLLNGKTSSLPRSVSGHLVQVFKQSFSTPYLEFANLHATLDRKQITSYVNEPHNRKVFEQDGNWGLVQRCLDALTARAILKMEKVFGTVELEHLARLVGLTPRPTVVHVSTAQPPLSPAHESQGANQAQQSQSGLDIQDAPNLDGQQVETYLARVVEDMIASRRLSARITEVTLDGGSKLYLEFLPVSRAKSQVNADLANALSVLQSSKWTVSTLDSQISSSRNFLEKAYQQSASRGTGNVGFGGGFSGFDGGVNSMIDEDLMTGGGGYDE